MGISTRASLWLAPAVAALGIALIVVFGTGLAAHTSRATFAVPGLRAAAAEGCAEDSSAAKCRDVEEMEVRDVVPLKEVDTHAVVLVSKKNGTVLPVFVDEPSAVAIAFRLAHRKAPHAMASDFLEEVVEALGGKVTEIRIDEVRGEVFQGRVFITQGKKHLQLSARPADSIALALGRGAKIFATVKVLAQAGITQDEIRRLHQRHGMPAAPGDEGPGVGGSGPDDSGPGIGGSGPDDEDEGPAVSPHGDRGKGDEVPLVPKPKKEIRL